MITSMLGKERSNILFREQFGEIPAIEDAAEESRFLLLQLKNFFFNGILGNHFVHMDLPGLTNTVRSVNRLLLNGWIPPGIEEDAVIRRGEIDANAAGFQADEEERGPLLILEALDFFLSLAGRAIQVTIG